ncbi:MAG: NUDIX domain-containing protein, partial [Candidatus Brocadiaceae bacterium]
GGQISWGDSYEGQLRELVGSRTLIIPATRSIVRDDEGRILLIRRKDNGEWGLPAGAVELGESVLEDCRREVREETGLEVLAAEAMAIYSEPRFALTDRYGNRRQMLTIVMLVEEWSGQIRRQTPETTDCRFFPLTALPELPDLYAETVEDLQRYSVQIILK